MRIKKLLRKELKFKISSNKNNIPIFEMGEEFHTYNIHFAKLQVLAQLPSFLKRRKGRGGEEKTSTS